MLVEAFQEFGTLGFSDHESYKVDSVHSRSIKKWHSLPAQQIAKMSNMVNPLLEECGYDQIDEYEVETQKEARRRYLNSLMVHVDKG